ncbi:MAG: SIR2 family protein [Sedimentisphaerales bacterium]|nr:SIR2 family protein [Sedimentisphaerales bacterium]
MNKKRIFILGAGFSNQVGMPLATELTDLLLEKFIEYNHKEMLEWYDWLKQRIKWLGEHKINIEQVFDLAKFDIEAWRMKQQKKQVGQRISNAQHNAEDIDTWLRWMEYDLGGVIWNKQKESKPEINKIIDFSKNLGEDDVVLTFNYDTLLEESLNNQEKAWYHGFEAESNKGIKILKMHGSINWKISCRENISSNDVLLFHKEEIETNKCVAPAPNGSECKLELFRITDGEVNNFYARRDFPFYQIDYVGISGLGAYKLLHLLPGSWEVWSNAMKALEEAEEIYVIGFSLSHYDSMVRLHFAGAMLSRYEKGNLPEKLILIDPYACKLKTNYQSVFGCKTPITIYQNKAQEINWHKLLKSPEA